MRKIFVLTFVLALTIISCEKENDPVENNNNADNNGQTEEVQPKPVENVSVEESDATVKVFWVLPENNNIEKIKIVYGDKEVVLSPQTTSTELTNLENFKIYKIEIYTIDAAGNISEAIEITATPFIYCNKINAKLPVSGEYQLVNGSNKIILGENSSYSLISSDNLEEGTISFSDDLSVNLDLVKKASNANSALNVLNFWNESYNNCLIFQTDTGVYLSFGWFEKIEGDPKKLTGRYTSYKITEGSFPNYDQDITNELVISEDGSWVLKNKKTYRDQNYTDSNTKDYSGTWTENDIKNNNYLLLSYQDKTFLKTNLQQVYKLIE